MRVQGSGVPSYIYISLITNPSNQLGVRISRESTSNAGCHENQVLPL